MRVGQRQWRHGIVLSQPARADFRVQERQRAASQQRATGSIRTRPDQRLGISRHKYSLQTGRRRQPAGPAYANNLLTCLSVTNPPPVYKNRNQLGLVVVGSGILIVAGWRSEERRVGKEGRA